ncbi:hypothetical protein ACIBQ6_02395 [Nonomuraea sp. NPDC049655]|uniref:hypothetical protein n=1 Tax=Nonomuraea sp. NPDC049655 TaxID=3364355 RepID=UPI0037B9CD7A
MADLPVQDRTDFEHADRGFVARLTPGVVRTSGGEVVWDNDVYDFLTGDCDTWPPCWSSPSRTSPSSRPDDPSAAPRLTAGG